MIKNQAEEILQDYQNKRNLEVSPEPKAEVSTEEGIFVLQEHYAEKAGIHYDFRLAEDGVLKSWVVRKGFPEEPSTKRMAIKVEDHPLSYKNFEGQIPEGQYGAGKVTIIDEGTAKIISKKPFNNPTRYTLQLQGSKVSGTFYMVHTKGDYWLLMKAKEVTAKLIQIKQAGKSKLPFKMGDEAKIMWGSKGDMRVGETGEIVGYDPDTKFFQIITGVGDGWYPAELLGPPQEGSPEEYDKFEERGNIGDRAQVVNRPGEEYGEIIGIQSTTGPISDNSYMVQFDDGTKEWYGDRFISVVKNQSPYAAGRENRPVPQPGRSFEINDIFSDEEAVKELLKEIANMTFYISPEDREKLEKFEQGEGVLEDVRDIFQKYDVLKDVSEILKQKEKEDKGNSASDHCVRLLGKQRNYMLNKTASEKRILRSGDFQALYAVLTDLQNSLGYSYKIEDNTIKRDEGDYVVTLSLNEDSLDKFEQIIESHSQSDIKVEKV